MRHHRLAVLGVIVLIVGVASLAGVAAFQNPQEWQTVKPGDPGQEKLPGTPLVFAAYAFVWVALVAYVWLLWRRIGRVERELVDLAASRKPGAAVSGGGAPGAR
jgi:CcmD family protein